MEAMKLMLVDDEERFLSTTQKLLNKKGIDVVTATSGAEALDTIEIKSIFMWWFSMSRCPVWTGMKH